MKKRQLKKDIWKSIHHSFGRFFSIMMLMALGSFALVGLFAAGPDMRKTGENYFNKLNTSDITILSDYGIDNSEQEYIQKASGIKDLEYIYLKDVVVENTDTSFRIFSKPEKVSLYELVEGSFPEKDDEIAIDSLYSDKYKIGDIIKFTEKVENEEDEQILKINEFKIVGYINSGDILSTLNRGQTDVGTGELNSYAIINKSVFNSDVYMMAKITFEDLDGVDPYSDEYTAILQAHKDELEKLLQEQQNLRLADIKKPYQEDIDEGKKEIEDAKQELENARNELEDARVQLDDAKAEIEENEKKLNNAKSKINDAQKEINEKESYLNQKETEYEEALNELNQRKEELQAAKNDLNKAQEEINANNTYLENGKIEYEQGIESLNEAITQIEALLSNPNLQEEQKTELQIKLEGYKAQLEQTKNEYNLFLSNIYNPGKVSLEQAQEEINLNLQETRKAETEIENAEKTLNEAKKELDSGKAALTSAKKEFSNSKSEYSEGLKQLQNAKKELQDKEKEYNEKLTEFQEEETEALQEIADNEVKLADAQKELDDLSLPTYSVDSRREIPGGEGYKIYGTVSEIIDSLAMVFPIFLYFVAALVTLTTMTRFVSEERINSGTLKALGYTDNDIIKKFTIYGFVAGMLGTIIGVVLGHTLLPYIVYNAYSTGFSIPKIELHFEWKITAISIILSLISSVLPAYVVAKKELQEKPARLLLPKAPKAGSKIFMERIKPLWKKMSFTHKVTARNIFRYKQRMFMTIFGVAGSATMLFAGFAVQSSISTINEKQFENIIKYDVIIALNDDLSADEENELDNLLNSDEINSYTSVYYEDVTKVAGKNNDKQEIKLIVSENDEEFSDYIYLNDRKTGEKLQFKDDGAIISERFAKLINAEVGDTITIIDSEDNKREIKITDICEMYAGHFIFMNATAYENIYGKEYETNGKLLLLNYGSIENTQKQSAKFMELSSVKGIVQNTTLYNQIDTIVVSLNQIMKILIIVASMLAIVILYNLTNINVSERIRELS
ncbi:MAG: FtsX-like permease family protein, partial [Clostridia bacterium]